MSNSINSNSLNNLSILQIRLLKSLIDTGSLKESCQALGISAPTGSYHLKNARDQFNDELFIRTKDGFIPTLFMNSIQRQLSAINFQVEELSRGTACFDPKNTHETLRIACADNAFLLFLNEISDKLDAAAPHLKLELIPQTSHLIEDMRQGDIDFTFHGSAEFPSDFHQLMMYKSHYTLMVDKKHTLVEIQSERAVTEEDCLSYQSIQIRLPHTDSEGTYQAGRFDDKKSPDWALRSYSFLGACLMLKNTPYTLKVPQPTAAVICPLLDYRTIDAECITQQPFLGRIIWHDRTHNCPLRQWFRSFLMTSVQNHPHN